jgi:hypothetical protein
MTEDLEHLPTGPIVYDSMITMEKFAVPELCVRVMVEYVR